MAEITVGDLGLLEHIQTVPEQLDGERRERLENAGKALSFGLSFFDEALKGIYPSDVVLVGADPGVGKTKMASIIADVNATQGKRILYLALEAENREIARRIKFCELSRLMLADRHPQHHRMNFGDWIYGLLDNITADYESKADAEMREKYKSMRVFYRNFNRFGAEEFKRLFMAEKDHFDLLLCDHLHYFDSDDDNENRAMKAIVKGIRDCALIGHKPVVLVGHIRKRDKRFRELVPDLDDFHGSSDIGKIATKAVTLAPYYDGANHPIYPTVLKACKFRFGSVVTRHIALTNFNIQTDTYGTDYVMGSQIRGGDGYEFSPHADMYKVPPWATSNRIPTFAAPPIEQHQSQQKKMLWSQQLKKGRLNNGF